jgi:hypothetical protein
MCTGTECIQAGVQYKWKHKAGRAKEMCVGRWRTRVMDIMCVACECSSQVFTRYVLLHFSFYWQKKNFIRCFFSLQINVSLDGKAVIGDSMSLVCFPGPAHHSKLTSQGALTATAGRLTRLNFQIFDQHENLCEPSSKWKLVSLVQTVEGKEPLESSVEVSLSSQNSIHTICFLPKCACEYSVHLLVDELELQGGPCRVACHPAAVSAKDCVLDGMEVVVNAVAGEAYSLILTALDAFGNIRTTGGDEFKISAFRDVRQTIVDEVEGLYRISLQPTIAGRNEIAVRHDGKDVAGSPFIISVTPAHASATHSRIVAQSASTGVAGGDVEVTVECRDVHGNVVMSGVSDLRIECSGEHAVKGKVEDLGNGLWRGVFAPTKSGRYAMRASIGGTKVGSSPAEYRVDASKTAVEKSVVSEVGRDVIAGEEMTFTIRSRDEFENDRLIGGDAVDVSLDGFGWSSFTDNQDGSYTVKFTLVEARSHSIHISLNGESVIGSPFTISCHPSRANGTKSAVADGGVPTCVAGSESQFVIEARDAWSNPLSCGGSTVSVDVRDGSKSSLILRGGKQISDDDNSVPIFDTTLSVTDLNNGRYLCKFIVPHHGLKKVCVCFFFLFFY